MADRPEVLTCPCCNGQVALRGGRLEVIRIVPPENQLSLEEQRPRALPSPEPLPPLSPRTADRITALVERQAHVGRQILTALEPAAPVESEELERVARRAALRAVEARGIPWVTVRSRSRRRDVVAARYAAMEAAREAGLGPTAIGRMFDRDHSTVLSALRKVGAG